jgi:hypothetical protein
MHVTRTVAPITAITIAALPAKPANPIANADGISARIGHRSHVSTARSSIEIDAIAVIHLSEQVMSIAPLSRWLRSAQFR